MFLRIAPWRDNIKKKQHCGFNDCQARSKSKLHFHFHFNFNAALTAVNATKQELNEVNLS